MRDTRRVRNPFTVTLLKEMYKWEVMELYDEVTPFTMAHYLFLPRPISNDLILPVLDDDSSDDQESEKRRKYKAGVIKDASSFMRSVFEHVKDLEYSDYMLDRLAACITIGSWGTFSSFEFFLKEKSEYAWAQQLITERRFSSATLKERDELNRRVQAALHIRVTQYRLIGQAYLSGPSESGGSYFLATETSVIREYDSRKHRDTLMLYTSKLKNTILAGQINKFSSLRDLDLWIVLNDVEQIVGTIAFATTTSLFYEKLLKGRVFLDHLTNSDIDNFGKGYLLLAIVSYTNDSAKEIIVRYASRLVSKAAFFCEKNCELYFCYEEQMKFLLTFGFRQIEDMQNTNLVYVAKRKVFEKLHGNIY